MYVIVDIETTGGNFKNGKITEVAIYKHDGNSIIDEFISLVNPECFIPSYITGLTGITNEMVASAPPFYQIANDILRICQDAVFVAHNAAFDYGFIQEEFNSLGFSFEMATICTVKLSRKLLPGHASYSLGNICTDLGISNSARHRAAGDAFATVALFTCLLSINNGILNPDDPYSQFSVAGLHPNLDIDFIKNLPLKTGVYYFHNEKGDIIYIGKSKNIRNRVLTHLNHPKTRKGQEMKQTTADISFECTGSELIALLKESHEIKKYKPLYNRAQKKSRNQVGLYLYTDRKGYKRLTIKSINKDEQPEASFENNQVARLQLFKWIDEFGLCQKLCGLYDGTHGCFQYQIKMCAGACVGEESSAEYNIKVDKLIERLSYGYSNLVILDQGKDESEASVVIIEKGLYLGYGYMSQEDSIEDIEDFKDYITLYHDNRDTRSIINNYLKDKKYRKIIPY